MVDGERFLTPKEVAHVMKVSTMTVYRLIAAGDLPAKNVAGRAFRIEAADFEAYLDGREIRR